MTIIFICDLQVSQSLESIIAKGMADRRRRAHHWLVAARSYRRRLRSCFPGEFQFQFRDELSQ